MLTVLFFALAQTPEPLRNANGPFEPAEAVKHLFVPPGFKVTPVAHEPAIVDPVCMCFDAKGRIFVCEMPGYPNGGRALGEETRGKIKMLEDKDGDGFFETATLFADGLRFPTGITPYKDGMIVCNAPDIIYLKDTTGDGKADLKEIWYTGFDLANIQQLPNSLQWGPDNRIWGMVAGTGGIISCPKKPDMKPVNLRGKAFRFDPATLGSFEPTSGGGQYGLCRDATGTWFTCSNGNCVRQIVLPEELVSRNPDYVPPAVTADIDVEGTSIKVFRKSPFEAWRVERTTRRREGDDNKKFIATELVPGGYTSSTCGCIIYDADLFPMNYYGSFFACDPGNNLIFRRVISPKGSIYQSSRPPEEKDHEFLASDDNWFRPVQLTLGPDGAIYVCDFYREVIETPLSIPDDMKKRLNVESRGRGRIWRITPVDKQLPKSDDFNRMNDEVLEEQLKKFNQTVRTISRRLLHERGEYFKRHERQPSEGSAVVIGPSASNHIRTIAAILASQTHVNDKLDHLLPSVLYDRYPNIWNHYAVLCALSEENLQRFFYHSHVRPAFPFAEDAAMILGRKGKDRTLECVFEAVVERRVNPSCLAALDKGLRKNGRSLAPLIANPPESLKETVSILQKRIDDAARMKDLSFLPALAFAPFDQAKPSLEKILGGDYILEIQIDAARCLGQHSNPAVAEILIDKFNLVPLAVRREILDVLFSTTDRTQALLTAIEKGKIKPNELDPARVQQLRNHPNANVRAKAVAILASSIPADRQKVLADYAGIIDMKGDVAKGKVVFQNQCVSCHKLDGIGNDVGPNLLATLTGKSTRDLMTAILDPNREVDTRFLSYTAMLNDGRVLTGIVASESANGLTLRQADGKEDSILRADIESLKSSGQSLMPEGMEKQIDKQALADLIAFLKQPRN
jgi:putative membrane-bound dehydrogenase-like protein